MVEMLVVLAIIALLMAIVVPRFAVSQKGAGLKGGATELMSALRTARRLAITDREVRALALDIYSIPARFTLMKQDGSDWVQLEDQEFERVPNNIAVVAVTTRGWTVLDVTRTDDVDPIDGIEEDLSAYETIYNPGNGNHHVNPIYHLVRFYPTGTSDHAVIYLWNITEGRRELSGATIFHALSNLVALGVPPGFLIEDSTNQRAFFRLPSEDSQEDTYYFTLVVNGITGSVTVYDYAWGTGEEDPPDYEWDRKKDGQ